MILFNTQIYNISKYSLYIIELNMIYYWYKTGTIWYVNKTLCSSQCTANFGDVVNINFNDIFKQNIL